MKSLLSALLLCLICSSAFADRDSLIIYHAGDGSYRRTEVIDHCVDNGYIRPKSEKQATYSYCQQVDEKGRVDLRNCAEEKVVTEIFKRHMYLKETIHLGADRIFTRYYRDQYVSKRSFETCDESIIKEPHGMYVTREATLQERLFYGALYQTGVKTIVNETISPKQASEGRWGEDGDRMRSIMIHYDSPNCRGGEVGEDVSDFSESDFFRMGGEGSGSGRMGGEGSGSGRLGGEGSGSGRLGGEGSGTGRVVTRVNITPQRINTLRILPNVMERSLGIKPAYSTYLTGEEKIPRSILGVRCQN